MIIIHSIIVEIFIASLKDDYSGALPIPTRLKRTAFLRTSFITGRLDRYTAAAGLPIWRLEYLDRVLRSSARFAGCLPKMWPCLQPYAGSAPLAPTLKKGFVWIIALVLRSYPVRARTHLRDLCCSALSEPGRRSLRSTMPGVLNCWSSFLLVQQLSRIALLSGRLIALDRAIFGTALAV